MGTSPTREADGRHPRTVEGQPREGDGRHPRTVEGQPREGDGRHPRTVEGQPREGGGRHPRTVEGQPREGDGRHPRTVEGQPRDTPDGGWGWVVTFCSFMITVAIDGIALTFGVFLTELLNQFDGSQAKTQNLNSVLFGTHLTLGPLAGVFVRNVGCRKVVICGSVIASVGIFLSTFSPSLDVMILLYGGVGGLGFGLMYLPAYVIVGHYFDKHRALACGITACGSGIGGFVFAPLSVYLLGQYGWKGTLWIFSGIVLNGAVFGAFYRPIDSINVKSTKEINPTNTISDSGFLHKVHRVYVQLSCFVKTNFDIYILCSPTFMVYAMSCCLAMTGYAVPFNFLPVLASDMGFSAKEGAFLISAIGISNTVWRILIGLLSDQPWTDSLLINNLALLIGGIATCFVPYYKIYGILASYACLFGITIAALIGLRPVIIVEFLGLDRLTCGFGMLGVFTGLAMFIGSPIAGALVDLSGSYHVTFYFSGVLISLAGILALPLRRISNWERNRQDKYDVTATHTNCSSETLNTYI